MGGLSGQLCGRARVVSEETAGGWGLIAEGEQLDLSRRWQPYPQGIFLGYASAPLLAICYQLFLPVDAVIEHLLDWEPRRWCGDS